MEDSREVVPIRMSIVAVEISSGKRTSIVSDDDAVRIQHWHDLEDEHSSQLLKTTIGGIWRNAEMLWSQVNN